MSEPNSYAMWIEGAAGEKYGHSCGDIRRMKQARSQLRLAMYGPECREKVSAPRRIVIETYFDPTAS